MADSSSVDAVEVIQDVLTEVDSYRPSNALLTIWFQKRTERGFYEEESYPDKELEYELIQLHLERLRRTILHIDSEIEDYFDDLDHNGSYHISYPNGDQIELEIGPEEIEDFVRDATLTNRVLTYYNTFVEVMKIRQSWLLLRGIFGRSLGPEQEECMNYVKEQLAYEQREHLLYWSGVIGEDLRGNMARLRGRRNKIIHSVDADHLDAIDHAITDLELTVEVMQDLSERDMVRTPLGRFDSLSEAWESMFNSE